MKLRLFFNIAGFLLIALGIVLFAYPKAVNKYSAVETGTLIKTFNADIDKEKADDNNELINKLKADSIRYNNDLVEKGQHIQDPFFYTGSSIDLSQYGLENNMFGYIEIPKMGVKLGIFLGATKENMNKGAVHLDKTSMPVGGVNTNCVIAGHRGNGRYGDMFRAIDKLEIGDKVYITNPWETLNYTVTEVFAISPEDIDKILIQQGKDMVTLVTCHPYGSSQYRYIVYCERG